MLEKKDFIYGTNESQKYYEFKNEINGDIVCVLQNNNCSYWVPIFMNNITDEMHTIQVKSETNVDTLLQSVCDWYNEGKKHNYIPDAPEISTSSYNKTLGNLSDMFGSFSKNAALRIQSFLNEPNSDRWNDIAGLLINGRDTVWQAILEIDSSFPRSGREYDEFNNLIKDWDRIPKPLEVQRAIKLKLNKK